MLTSVRNPLVKQLRRLHQAKGRQEDQCFLLEGTHLLESALAVQCFPLLLCHTEKWQERYPNLWEIACYHAQRVELVSPEVLAAIATTLHPDGVVAALPRTAIPSPCIETCHLGLVVETLQDPGNLGTLIRTSVAVGAGGLWLSPNSVDLDHPKVLRASAGAWFHLPMAASSDLETILHQGRMAGRQIIATRVDAPLTYWQVDLTRPTVLLFGNEGAGLSDRLTDCADVAVTIPLEPGVESLNVAIAAALILYEARRQRATSSS